MSITEWFFFYLVYKMTNMIQCRKKSSIVFLYKKLPLFSSKNLP